MTDDEGLSVREAVEWCGSGVTVREVTRLRHLAQDPPGRRRMSARRSVRPAWLRCATVDDQAAVNTTTNRKVTSKIR